MPSHALKPWKITLLRAQAPTELSNSGWGIGGKHRIGERLEDGEGLVVYGVQAA